MSSDPPETDQPITTQPATRVVETTVETVPAPVGRQRLTPEQVTNLIAALGDLWAALPQTVQTTAIASALFAAYTYGPMLAERLGVATTDDVAELHTKVDSLTESVGQLTRLVAEYHMDNDNDNAEPLEPR